MCNPAAAGLAITALGTATSAAATQENASFQAAIERRNEQQDALLAKDALARGAEKAQDEQMRLGQLMATQRAAAGSSGVKGNTGSVADVEADTARIGQIDLNRIRNNAFREAWGLKVRGSEAGTQASLDEEAGQAGTVTTLLGGATRAFSGFAQQYPYIQKTGLQTGNYGSNEYQAGFGG